MKHDRAIHFKNLWYTAGGKMRPYGHDNSIYQALTELLPAVSAGAGVGEGNALRLVLLGETPDDAVYTVSVQGTDPAVLKVRRQAFGTHHSVVVLTQYPEQAGALYDSVQEWTFESSGQLLCELRTVTTIDINRPGTASEVAQLAWALAARFGWVPQPSRP
jgi:hypothetical protein